MLKCPCKHEWQKEKDRNRDFSFLNIFWVFICMFALVNFTLICFRLFCLNKIEIRRLEDLLIALWHILLTIVNKRRGLANKLKLVGYICDQRMFNPNIQIHMNWFLPSGLISECFCERVSSTSSWSWIVILKWLHMHECGEIENIMVRM